MRKVAARRIKRLGAPAADHHAFLTVEDRCRAAARRLADRRRQLDGGPDRARPPDDALFFTRPSGRADFVSLATIADIRMRLAARMGHPNSSVCLDASWSKAPAGRSVYGSRRFSEGAPTQTN